MSPEGAPNIHPDALPTPDEIDVGFDKIMADGPEINEVLKDIKPDELANALEARLDEINTERLKQLAMALEEILKQAE